MDYGSLTPTDLVVTDFDGRIVEGSLRDQAIWTCTHNLYREFPQINFVVHAHSGFATAWTQAGQSISYSGTTRADLLFTVQFPLTNP